MISGTKLWSSYIPLEMKQMKVSENRIIETYPDLPESLYASFDETAKRYPGKTAAADDCGHSMSYEEMRGRTDRLASWLYFEKKVARGTQVAVLMYNSVEFCTAFLALNKLGAVVIPLQTKYRKPEIEALLSQTEVALILSDPDFSGWFSAFEEKGVEVVTCGDIHQGYGWAEFEEETPCEVFSQSLDDALIVFTSGTTSRSKGVVIKNYNIMHAIISYQKTLGVTQDDISVIPIPMYLITGLIAVFGLFMHTGGTVYIHQFFNAPEVLRTMAEKKATFFHASPTVFSLLLDAKDVCPELPSLKKFACGSSNMPKEKIRQLHKWLPHSSFHTVYGLSETTSPGTIFPVDAAASPFIGSSGIPIPGMSVKIIRENGEEAAVNEIGEVLLQGANLLDRYYHRETSLLDNNWLHTGDLGYINEEGYLYIADRKKDMINRGGEKICSFDVENELYQIPGILDAAVVALPDSLYGEVPAAVIRTEEGFSMEEGEIRAILKTRLASYQVPVRIRRVKTIPVTPNNKIDKKYMRTHFEEMNEG